MSHSQQQQQPDDVSQVHRVDLLWIPVGGCGGVFSPSAANQQQQRLACTAWFPTADVSGQRWPALLEIIPYRRNDGTAVRDSKRHPYLAANGFVCVRADLRGSGDSDGVLLDEYLPSELSDAYDAIEWIAAQPWCSGKVGMFGKSWGAFNAIQVAALQPPHLAAVIVVAGTDDRYNEDVHYLGDGCVQMEGLLPWAAVMLGYNCAPPDPRNRPDDWYELWLERVSKTPFFAEAWLKHQTRDAFWMHGSVCEDYAAIDVPVLAVAGWADGYTSSAFRFLSAEALSFKGNSAEFVTQRKRFAIVGPWAHQYPEEGEPGPQIAFAQESVAWWGTWLRGDSTRYSPTAASDRFPAMRAFLLDWTPPARSHPPQRAGAWIGLPFPLDEPSPQLSLVLDVEQQGGYLLWADTPEHSRRHRPTKVASVPRTVNVPWSSRCGLSLGSWWGFGECGENAGDQRIDDAFGYTVRSLVPLQSDVALLGFPVLRGLRVSGDRYPVQVAVRVSASQDPLGPRTLLSWGCQQVFSASSTDIVLRPVGTTLKRGAYVHVSLTAGLFPMLHPSPHTGDVHLQINPDFESAMRLELPRVPENLNTPPGDTAALFAATAVHHSPAIQPEVLQPGRYRRVVTHDLSSDYTTVTIDDDEGLKRFDATTGVLRGGAMRTEHRIREGDPLSATTECWHNVAYAFPTPNEQHCGNNSSGAVGGAATSEQEQQPSAPLHNARDRARLGIYVATRCKLSTPNDDTFLLEHSIRMVVPYASSLGRHATTNGATSSSSHGGIFPLKAVHSIGDPVSADNHPPQQLQDNEEECDDADRYETVFQRTGSVVIPRRLQ
jgi:predicted acyl esterase